MDWLVAFGLIFAAVAAIVLAAVWAVGEIQRPDSDLPHRLRLAGAILCFCLAVTGGGVLLLVGVRMLVRLL